MSHSPPRFGGAERGMIMKTIDEIVCDQPITEFDSSPNPEYSPYASAGTSRGCKEVLTPRGEEQLRGYIKLLQAQGFDWVQNGGGWLSLWRADCGKPTDYRWEMFLDGIEVPIIP